MKEYVVTQKEAGRRLDSYIQKKLPSAGFGFICKMVRKKNITVNGKKVEINAHLNAGDTVEIYLSDETFETFAAGNTKQVDNSDMFVKAYKKYKDIKIVYEDDDFIFVDKPVGILSQMDKTHSDSMNEWLVGYLLFKNVLDKEDLDSFKPAFCNRLDRNTSGLLLGGKSVKALQILSELLRDRNMHKYYYALLEGNPDSRLNLKKDTFLDLHAYLKKDHKNNRVEIFESKKNLKQNGFEEIHTGVRLIEKRKDSMLVEVELFTGKSHQIRAHMAYYGHPIVGDPAYGIRKNNDGKRYQLLRAVRVSFPKLDEFPNISEKEFVINSTF